MTGFDSVRLTDATVYGMLKHGRSLEETIVALVCEKNRFTQRIIELESIAPRKIVLPDGRVFVWRCPDELVPEMLRKYDKEAGVESGAESSGGQRERPSGLPADSQNV